MRSQGQGPSFPTGIRVPGVEPSPFRSQRQGHESGSSPQTYLRRCQLEDIPSPVVPTRNCCSGPRKGSRGYLHAHMFQGQNNMTKGVFLQQGVSCVSTCMCPQYTCVEAWTQTASLAPDHPGQKDALDLNVKQQRCAPMKRAHLECVHLLSEKWDI